MRRLLYANLVNRAPATRDGNTVTFPPFLAGEQATFAIRFLDDVAGSLVQTTLDVVSIRAGVGRRDAAPTRGTFSLKIGAAVSGSTNTTSALPYNASTQAVAAALNAVTDGTGDYSVTRDGPDYLIRRTGGETFVLAGAANELEPTSFVRVRTATRNSITTHRVTLVQAPMAFTDSFDTVVPEAPSVNTVRDGGSDPSNTYFWNEIQELYVPPDFRGTYQLKRGYARTSLLDITDGPEEIQAALNAILSEENGSVAVTNPQAQKAMIEFRGDLGGIDLDPLEVTVFSAPPGDPTFVIDLNTQEIFRELAQAVAVDLVFEVEVDARIVPGDEGSGIRTIKLWSVPVTVARPVNWEGLAAAQNIDWLRPPGPRDYVPFTEDQILTGQQQAFSAVIGDGEATEFSIDHNLSSELCQVVVRENSSGGRLIPANEYEVALDSDDSLTITFDAAPGEDALAVFVVAIGPESVFQSHTHTQAQIVGLVDLLDALGERVETLETILPSTGPAATNASQPSGIEIELPQTKEALFFKGAAVESFTAAALGRAPMMLPAVHDATITDFSALPLPAVAADTVWQNTTGATLDLGRGIYGGKVLDDGFFASDGRALYAVNRSGTSTSYFPAGFDRELWRIYVNDKMLRLNRTLDVQFGLATQLANATSNAQWLLVIERGTATSQSTPTTPDTNLENIVWESSPVLSQRIILTQNRQTHSFGARIKRALVSSVDTITMDTMLYGVWEGADALAPTTANFALRARLIHFDTENALASDARGWVTYEITPPHTDAEKPKAVIL